MMKTIEVSTQPVHVSRWPSERPLLAAVALLSLACWAFLILSIIGIVYAVLLGVFFLVSHVAFIAHLRGSAVRLGPEQMPELYARVVALARRIGLRSIPDVYVIQAGGSLNALATRFFQSNFVVLFSDLLEACGDNTQARDMIIAHELAHLRMGHLRFRWFLLPGMLFPFIGQAFSRAREYTCDRYGFAVCENQEAALRALSILAAGGRHGATVNLQALARQRNDLDTTLMTIGRWLSTHPPIADRLVAAKPDLVAGAPPRFWGPASAVAMMASAVLVPSLLGAAFAPSIALAIRQVSMQAQAGNGGMPGIEQLEAEHDATTEQAWSDMHEIAAVLEQHRNASGSLPRDTRGVYEAWKRMRPESEAPVDPFAGRRYGYQLAGNEYFLWSEGPESDSVDDDLVYSSLTQRARF